MKGFVEEMSFTVSVEWKAEGVTDGESEVDDCDEVICVGWGEPGGQWIEWRWRNDFCVGTGDRGLIAETRSITQQLFSVMFFRDFSQRAYRPVWSEQ